MRHLNIVMSEPMLTSVAQIMGVLLEIDRGAYNEPQGTVARVADH